MIEGWSVVALALGYVSVLFALAWYADRAGRFGKAGDGRPLIYALSLAVYCTSWTFFGSVGLAASTGYDFLPVYLGPILLFALRLALPAAHRAAGQEPEHHLGRRLPGRALRQEPGGRRHRHRHRRRRHAALHRPAAQGGRACPSTRCSARGRCSSSICRPTPPSSSPLPMATFAVLFGTRHIDATEHQEGLIVAVAAESLVKLAAFLTVGFFVVFSVFGGFGGFFDRVQREPRDPAAVRARVSRRHLDHGDLPEPRVHRAAAAPVPRHGGREQLGERRSAAPPGCSRVYLVLINLFVVPIAAAGLLTLAEGLLRRRHVRAGPAAVGRAPRSSRCWPSSAACRPPPPW